MCVRWRCTRRVRRRGWISRWCRIPVLGFGMVLLAGNYQQEAAVVGTTSGRDVNCEWAVCLISQPPGDVQSPERVQTISQCGGAYCVFVCNNNRTSLRENHTRGTKTLCPDGMNSRLIEWLLYRNSKEMHLPGPGPLGPSLAAGLISPSYSIMTSPARQ